MQRAATAAGAVAEPDVAAGLDLQHVGEILGGHRRDVVAPHAGLPEHRAGRAPAKLGFIRTIHRRRVAPIVADRNLRAEGGGDSRAQTLDRAFDEILDLRLEGANRTAQDSIIRDDVERFAAVDLRHADHRRFARMQAARDDGLQRQHEMARDEQRIDALVRHGRVAAVAADGDFEGTGAGHHRPRHYRHLADGDPRPVVQAIDGFHRELIEQPVLDHHVGAGFRLLSRLEDEADGSVKVQRVLVLGEVTRGAEQQRRVSVMAAGVHFPRMPRAIREAVLLIDRQRVHVGAQADGAGAAALAQDADNPGLRQSAMHFQTIRRELAGDDIGGTRLVEGQFRVGVNIVTERDQVGEKRDIQ